MKPPRICLAEYVNPVNDKSFEVWQEVNGEVIPHIDGKPMLRDWVGTQAEYDAIAVKDANTQYNTDAGIYIGETLVSGGGGSALPDVLYFKTDVPDDENGIFIKFDGSTVSPTTGKKIRGAPANVPFTVSATNQGSFPGEKYINPIAFIGYNIRAGGGNTEVESNHGWGIGFEADYWDQSRQTCEFYLTHYKPAGAGRQDVLSFAVSNEVADMGKVLISDVRCADVGFKFITSDYSTIGSTGDAVFARIGQFRSEFPQLVVFNADRTRILADYDNTVVHVPRQSNTNPGELLIGFNSNNFVYANPTNYVGGTLSIKQGGNGNSDGKLVINCNTNVTTNGGLDAIISAGDGTKFFELIRNDYNQGFGTNGVNHLSCIIGHWNGADGGFNVAKPSSVLITGNKNHADASVLHVTAQKNLSSGTPVATFVAQNGSGALNTCKIGRNAELILAQVAADTVDTPPAGSISLFFDTTSGKIAYKKSDGSTVTTFA